MGEFEHLVQEPDIWGGAWTVNGTRVPVFILRDYYASMGWGETLEAYPGVSSAALEEAIAADQMLFEADRERQEEAWGAIHDEAMKNVVKFRCALEKIANADLRRCSAGWLQDIAREALR